jgi:hypothetical protein
MFEKSFDGRMTHNVQGLSKKTHEIWEATYFGLAGANRNYRYQVGNVVEQGLNNVGNKYNHCLFLGPKPCVIGECG